MFIVFRFCATALLVFSGAGLAQPDVGFSDSDAYLAAEYTDDYSQLKFTIENGPVAEINLPNDFYTLQALRDFARNYNFNSSDLAKEIKDSLGEDNEDFGNSFESKFNAQEFLKEFERFLRNFNAQNENAGSC